MVTYLRVEAEASTIAEVTADLDAAEAALRKAAKNADLHLHDEHYERVTKDIVKARRVFRRGEGFTAKSLPQSSVPFIGTTSGTSGVTYTLTNAA